MRKVSRLFERHYCLGIAMQKAIYSLDKKPKNNHLRHLGQAWSVVGVKTGCLVRVKTAWSAAKFSCKKVWISGRGLRNPYERTRSDWRLAGARCNAIQSPEGWHLFNNGKSLPAILAILRRSRPTAGGPFARILVPCQSQQIRIRKDINRTSDQALVPLIPFISLHEISQLESIPNSQ